MRQENMQVNRNPIAQKMKGAIFGMALVTIASTAIASLTDGLVAYYPLDGSANDASGNSHNGTAYGGVTFEPGVTGQAARFNGSTSFIQAQDNSVGNLGANGTLAFWFRADPANAAGSRMFEKDDRAYWWFVPGPNYVAVDLRSAHSYGNPQWHLQAQTPTSTSAAWTAVALRKNGTTFDLFIDGQLEDTVTNAAADVVTTAPLTLGRSYYWNAGYYSGLLDEVRVYDRALSNGEIGQLAAVSGPSEVPEPSTVLMLFSGLAALARRRQRTSILA